MARLSRVEDIERLYAARGGLRYGEGVTQIEHALQCAALLEEQGASPGLIAAGLLHDIGHLFEDESSVTESGLDDRHEATGANALAGLFVEAVWKPIALHVSAKRYLCFKERPYFEALSPASKQSLALQGGPFDAAKAAAFEKLPHWQDAVLLRRADDAGKREEPSRHTFADFTSLLWDLRINIPS